MPKDQSGYKFMKHVGHNIGVYDGEPGQARQDYRRQDRDFNDMIHGLPGPQRRATARALSTPKGTGTGKAPSAYAQFVRENVGKMSGATQPERMKQVAALWRQKKGQQGKGDDIPHNLGKGQKVRIEEQAPPPAAAKGRGRKRGGCADCGKGKGLKNGGRRRRAGEIVAEAPPMQWRGGGIGEPGYSALDMGNSLPRPRFGLGAFAPLVGQVGGGIKMPPDQGQSGEGFMDNLMGLASMFG